MLPPSRGTQTREYCRKPLIGWLELPAPANPWQPHVISVSDLVHSKCLLGRPEPKVRAQNTKSMGHKHLNTGSIIDFFHLEQDLCLLFSVCHTMHPHPQNAPLIPKVVLSVPQVPAQTQGARGWFGDFLFSCVAQKASQKLIRGYQL